jgi:16S rRNA (adenine1518-N6/adenine1519-N6)-dimethyltransferase
VLSVLIQAWYDVDYLFTVHENVFNPPPKVKSAVIRLTRNSKETLGCDERLFRRIVKTVFTMRRKMMRNGMKQILPKESEMLADPIFNLRPEQLSVEDFISLTNRVSEELDKMKK